MGMGIKLYLFDEASDRNPDELRTRPLHSADKNMSPAIEYLYIFGKGGYPKTSRFGHADGFRKTIAFQQLKSLRSLGRMKVVPSGTRLW